jgi:hypothetical protein
MTVAKSKRGKSEGEKYIPVPMVSRGDLPLNVGDHLRTFIAAFVHAEARSRWEHCLLEAPQKARKRLQYFRRDLDPAYCRELPGAESFPLRLAGVYGDQVGVYFDGKPPARLVTAAEAATLATEDFADALLSLQLGKRALCFDHEGGAWLCER